jgi:hypothetical protein
MPVEALGPLRPIWDIRPHIRWTNWTGSYTTIDDAPDDPDVDSDYAYTHGLVGETLAWYRITELPVGFRELASLTVTARLRTSGMTDDQIVLFVQAYQDNYTTALSDELAVGTFGVADADFTTIGPVEFAGLVPADEFAWENVYIRVRTWYLRTKHLDAGRLELSALEFNGTYWPSVVTEVLTGTAVVIDPTLVRTGPRIIMDASETCTIVTLDRNCVLRRDTSDNDALVLEDRGLLRFDSLEE